MPTLRTQHSERASFEQVLSSSTGKPDVSGRVRRRWRGGTALSLALVLARPRRVWPSMALLCLGMLAAVTLICLVPLYTRLGSDAQLQQVLRSSPTYQINAEVAVRIRPVNAQKLALIQANRSEFLQGYLENIAPISTVYLQSSAPLQLLRINGQSLDVADHGLGEAAEIQALAYDDAQAASHMRILAGRLPQDGAATTQTPEVLSTPELGVRVGDSLTLGFANQMVTARVAGIWQPRDAQDTFWNGRSFEATQYGANGPPPQYPLLFTQDGFLSAFGASASSNGRSVESTPGAIAHIVFYTDRTYITTDNLQSVILNAAAFRRDAYITLAYLFGDYNVTVDTQLDSVLTTVAQQLALLAQPLVIVDIQMLGLMLLFLVAIAELRVEAQATEIATLKSRGASDVQIVAAVMLQSLMPAAIAVAAGPSIGVLASLLLIHLFVSRTGGSSLDAYLTSQAQPHSVLLPAILGALVALAVLTVATWRATQRDILALRREQGRTGGAPFWQRVYLDVALAIICAAAYLSLSTIGALAGGAQLGSSVENGAWSALTRPDLFALASPALLAVVGALLALRLFPWLLALGAHLASRMRGAIGVLAFAQASRTPAAFSRLTLILALSVGVGLFALTCEATLHQNALDRAAFANGSDVRVVIQGQQVRPALSDPSFFGPRSTIPHARAAARIYRTAAAPSADPHFVGVGVLAVDPSSLTHVALWQNISSARSFPALMDQMRQRQRPTASPPGDADRPLWVLIDPTCAAALHLAVGDRFRLSPEQEPLVAITFVVGGIVDRFPTMDDARPDGYVIADLEDYLTALSNSGTDPSGESAAAEYWVRTDGTAAAQRWVAQAVRAAALRQQGQAFGFTTSITTFHDVAQQFLSDPLTSGMTGLLLGGAGCALILAMLVTMMDAVVHVYQGATQFVVLRTLGMARSQLIWLLLLRQAVIYLFGLLVGTVLGLLLTLATLPYLEVARVLESATVVSSIRAPATSVSAATSSGPPPTLSFGGTQIAAFYIVLVLAAGGALGYNAWRARHTELGRSLRFGED